MIYSTVYYLLSEAKKAPTVLHSIGSSKLVYSYTWWVGLRAPRVFPNPPRAHIHTCVFRPFHLPTPFQFPVLQIQVTVKRGRLLNSSMYYIDGDHDLAPPTDHIGMPLLANPQYWVVRVWCVHQCLALHIHFCGCCKQRAERMDFVYG